MVKTFYLEKIISDEAIKKRVGDFFDESDFDLIVNEDADVFSSDGNLLLKLRKSVIEPELANLSIESFAKYLSKSSSYRGKAAGKIDVSLLSGNIVDVVSPENYKSRVIFKDGTVSDYYVANKTHSMIAGFFDKPTLRERSKVLKEHQKPCRMTAFSQKEVAKWDEVQPLIKEVDRLYQQICPDEYKYQSTFCQRVPDFCIKDTIFSTITVNLNWRTALHQDVGDLSNGYSALTVSEMGDWSGAYLGFPQWGVAADLRQGDLLIIDPHQYHCNTPFESKSSDALRMSMVYYFREGMLKCE